MKINLEFKEWLSTFMEDAGVISNAETTIIDILKRLFGLRGEKSDSAVKEKMLKDIELPEDPTTGRQNILKLIKDQNFYKTATPKQKAALDDITTDDTVGKIVDIITGSQIDAG